MSGKKSQVDMHVDDLDDSLFGQCGVEDDDPEVVLVKEFVEQLDEQLKESDEDKDA